MIDNLEELMKNYLEDAAREETKTDSIKKVAKEKGHKVVDIKLSKNFHYEDLLGFPLFNQGE